MDLSVNKISKNNLIGFKGVKGGFNDKNVQVVKFYPPAYDKQNENAYLQIAPIKIDEETGAYISLNAGDFLKPILFDEDKPLEIEQEKFKDRLNNILAYRYIIEKKDTNERRFIVDSFKKMPTTDGLGANFLDIGYNYGVTPKTGAMRHSFIDSDVILDKNGLMKKTDPDFVRNHFNKLGGSIKGLTYLLKETSELDPYRYIISTPDIGVDTISSHKYWPNNQYQCTNVEDFKNFIFELYKKGKGYVADGAFTSQGLQSPIVQHVLKWGEKSPFFNMLKIEAQPKPVLGILPDRTDMEDVGDLAYIGVKIVNNRNNSKTYDPNKPMYIQFFDTRLVKDETRDSDELIKQYDKNPDDHYDITNHQNSIAPYYFEIDHNDARRLSEFKDRNYVMLDEVQDLNDFLEFDNFSIGQKSNASGANFWDGNRDIVKMNLSNPINDPKNVKGFFDARNYLYGVASYWSELIQTDLIDRTLSLSEKELREVAKENDINNFDEIKNSLGKMKFPILEQNKTVLNYIEEFPLQSIETDPDLSAIFSEPEFKDEFLNKTYDKIFPIIDNAITSVIPDKYKNNAEYKTYVTKLYANTLIRNLLIGSMCPKALNSEGKTNLDNLREVSLYSLGAGNARTVEEERNIIENKLTTAINSEAIKGTVNNISEKLKSVELDDFKLAEAVVLRGKAGLNWRFDASKDIGDLDNVRSENTTFEKVWYGEDGIPGVQDFWTDFVGNIKTYNPSAYIISEVTNMGWFPWNKGKENFNSKLAKQGYGNNAMANFVEADFMNKTGSSTVSNYSYYFNQLSKFAGTCPEKVEDTDSTAGNVSILKSKMEEMMEGYQSNAAILSHTFVDNHDKPRLLHAMPLDMRLFLNDDSYLTKLSDEHKAKISALTGRNDYPKMASSALAVGLALNEALEKRYTGEELKNLKASLRRLVNGQVNDDSKPNFRRADAFGNLPYEVTIRDLFKGAGINDEEEMLNFRFDFLKKYIEYEVRLWEVINAVIGTPTLFNGTEFFQTGYETPSKNFYVANRNQVQHELKNDERFKKYYQTMQDITSIYKKPGLGAIRNGFPVLGDIISLENNKQILPIYRADENDSKVISLITNNGMPEKNTREATAKNEPITLKSIDLDFNKEILDSKMPLKRIYIDPNGKLVQEDTLYNLEKTVKDGKMKYSITRQDGKAITLLGTVETFYYPKAEIIGKYANSGVSLPYNWNDLKKEEN